MRPSGRQPDQLREIRFTRQYTRHAEGSVLVEFGNTKVLCTASVISWRELFYIINNRLRILTNTTYKTFCFRTKPKSTFSLSVEKRPYATLVSSNK